MSAVADQVLVQLKREALDAGVSLDDLDESSRSMPAAAGHDAVRLPAGLHRGRALAAGTRPSRPLGRVSGCHRPPPGR